MFPDYPQVETHDIIKKVKLHVESLKKTSKDVVIVAQDYTRQNWVNHLIVREIAAVVPEKKLSIVVAGGLHRACTVDELGFMFSTDIVEKIPIYSHNPLEPLPHSMFADKYLVAIHCSLPHTHVGMSTIGKLIMPGLSDGKEIISWHRYYSQDEAIQTMMDHVYSFDMVFDYGINDLGDVIKFYGHSIKEYLSYQLHISDLRKMYTVHIQDKLPDVVVLKPMIKNKDFILSMNAMQVMMDKPIVKEGGTICILNPEANEMGVHYGFMQPNGLFPAYYDEVFEKQLENRTLVFAMYRLQEHWIQKYFKRQIFNFKNENALFDFLRSRHGEDAVIHEYEGADIMIGV